MTLIPVHVRLIPVVVLIAMVYWLWRYRRTRISPQAGAASTGTI